MADDLHTPLVAFQEMKDSDSKCEDTNVPDLKTAKKVIEELGHPFQLQQLINNGDREKFNQYLYAVVEIQQSINSGLVTGYETHGSRAIKSLHLVFRGILDCSISANTSSDPSSSSLYSSGVPSTYSYELQGRNRTCEYELSSEKIYYLRSIVEKLNAIECLGDCIDVYKNLRRSAVDAKYQWFRIGKWTATDLQKLDSRQFAAKINIWIQVAKIFYDGFFVGERLSFEQIFKGVTAATYHNCFVPIVEHVAVELNNFASAVSSIASFQNLFPVLDLYSALGVILPDILIMFSTSWTINISQGAINIQRSLLTLVGKLLCSFEDTVQNELSTALLPEGTVHFLTAYAMEYVTKISLHKELLRYMIESPTKSLGNQADDQFLNSAGGTPLALRVVWIIISLRINLERKSSHYRDAWCRYVFVTTNVNYIINTITSSPELLDLIGEEYSSKLSTYIAQARQDYSSTIWDRVLYCLRDDGLKHKFLFYNRISRNSVKNRFKTFNTTFEEACQSQCKLFVPDIDIDSQFHMLILSKLLPAYKIFLEKYSSHLQSEKYKERCIKYSSEDLQSKIQTLFTEKLIVHNGTEENLMIP
ncbi:hypothetical protein ACET3Z_004219 [Daucus carota]